MRKFSSILVAALFVAAAAALGQNADKNTAGPTANQLQLRLTEPAEGATITGDAVRVGILYNRTSFGQGQGTKFGEADFPHPIFDIYLDNELKESLKGGEANVATIENVPAGDHRIVVMAKNISGEVIDRKEVKIRTTAAVSSPSMTPDDRPAAETEQPMTSAPPAPAPAPAPAETMERETTMETPEEEERASTLPATGSSYPRAAAIGLALIAAGLLLGRKVR